MPVFVILGATVGAAVGVAVTVDAAVTVGALVGARGGGPSQSTISPLATITSMIVLNGCGARANLPSTT